MLQNGNNNYYRSGDLVKILKDNKYAVIQPLLNGGITYTDRVLLRILNQNTTKSFKVSDIQFVSSQNKYKILKSGKVKLL